METNEISLHQVKVFEAVRTRGTWITVREVCALVDGVAKRTVAAHIKKLVELGLFDLAEVFPEHRYRFSEFSEKRNKTYLQRLEFAKDVFGL